MEEYQARSSMTQERYKPIQELKKRAKGDENKQRRIAVQPVAHEFDTTRSSSSD